MTELAAMKERLLEQNSLETVYDLFCQELELRIQALEGADSPECPRVLAAAVRSVACKIQVEQMLTQAEPQSC